MPTGTSVSLDVIRAVREASERIHIHGFTALEVTEGARRLGEPLVDYLRRLKEAGLATLPILAIYAVLQRRMVNAFVRSGLR